MEPNTKRRTHKWRNSRETLFRCEECDLVYDHYTTYDPANYIMPKYGKEIKGLCHNCRKRRPDYLPREGTPGHEMLYWMAENKVIVKPRDYKKFGFVSDAAMRSYLSSLKPRRVIRPLKDDGLLAYALNPEYEEKFTQERTE